MPCLDSLNDEVDALAAERDEWKARAERAEAALDWTSAVVHQVAECEEVEPNTLAVALLEINNVFAQNDAQTAIKARDKRIKEKALREAAEPLIWEDTRDVSFDDSVQWGIGYDYDPWELLREEANTEDGRFAVWKCPVHGWSYYGGSLGWHQGGFADEAAAKDAVRSHHILALINKDKTDE